MRLFFTALFFLFSFQFYAQGIILKGKPQTHKKMVRYNKYPNDEERISNFLLEQIHSDKAQYTPVFNLEYTTDLKIEFIQNKYYLTYSLYDIKFSEKQYFKNIDITNLFLPTHISAQVELIDVASKMLFNIKIDTCCLTNPKDFHEWLLPLNTNDSVKIKAVREFKIVNSNISFTSYNIDNYKNYIRLIQEYYDTEKITSDISLTLNTIQADNIDMMPLYQIDINKVQRQFDKIESLNFYTQLDISESDPLNFKGQYRFLKERYAVLSTVVNHLMSSIDEVYFNKGYSFLLKKNYDNAIAYFERSIKANPLYVRSHYRLAEVYFIIGNTEKSAEIIAHVVNNLKIEKDIEANVIALAQQIMNEFIERGEQKIKEENFHLSLIEFEKADTFCKRIHLIKCHPSIVLGFENSRLGLYNSYLTIAKKAIENNKIELAAKFIYDAKSYLNDIGSLNINPKETDDIIAMLIEKLIEQGRYFYNENDFEKAINSYNKAMDLCKTAYNRSCIIRIENEITLAKTSLNENILSIIKKHIDNNDLEKAEILLEEAQQFQKEHKVSYATVYETENLIMKLDKAKYKNDIFKGVDLLNKGFNEDAIAYFLKAKIFEKNNIAFPDPFLNEYLQRAGKPILMNQLSEAKIKTWGNDLEGAKNLLSIIENSMVAYMLSNDSLILSQYNELIIRIKEQECVNLIFENDMLFISAKRHIENKDYMSAYDALNLSITKINSLKHCKTDSLRYSQLKNEIAPFYSYQLQLQNISEYYSSLQFNKADSIFLIIKNLYENNSKIRDEFNVFLPDNILNAYNDAVFLKAFALHYNNRANYEQALKALKKAQKMNFSASAFSDIQKLLAQNMAYNDYKKNKKTHSSIQFINYDVTHEWFSVFRKSYKKKLLKLKILKKE